MQLLICNGGSSEWGRRNMAMEDKFDNVIQRSSPNHPKPVNNSHSIFATPKPVNVPVNKFSTQLNPVAGGAWNFAARFLLSAAAGDPQVMSDVVSVEDVKIIQDMSESRLR